MGESNLAWWDTFEVTDTKYTKKMTTGSKLTSINPEYQVKRFTELFGPCGKGWGFTVTHSEIIEGALMTNNALDDTGRVIYFGPCKIHTARVELWYMDEDKKHTIEGTGHTPFVYLTKTGLFITDMEYEKKSITDALTKAMSMLGMGGDIRMGRFDDSEYVANLQRNEAIDGAVDKKAEMIKQRQEFDEWFLQTLELMRTATSMHELEVLFKSQGIRVGSQGSDEEKATFKEVKNQRVLELKAEKQEQAE